MPKIPNYADDPVTFLVRRKHPGFPFEDTLIHPEYPISAASMRERREKEKAAEAYYKKIKAKPKKEIEKLFKAEEEKMRLEWQEKHEEAERRRFYNLPDAQADYTHWAKAAYWTLDEAVALSFGKDPKTVSWDRLEDMKIYPASPFIEKYRQVRDLAFRAKVAVQLTDPVAPSVFVAWARRNDIVFPEKLEKEAIARAGNAAVDWKAAHDKLLIEYKKLKDQSKSEPASASQEKSLKTRERDTLLKLVLGMAIDGYGYDPKASRSPAPGGIARDLATRGIFVDEDTVRKWLNTAKEEVDIKTE